jgi:hypothetical protein
MAIVEIPSGFISSPTTSSLRPMKLAGWWRGTKGASRRIVSSALSYAPWRSVGSSVPRATSRSESTVAFEYLK